MKIQCNVCEVAEATLLCCADEAALCWACDEKVHAANKLASKHQRVSLSGSASSIPKCDICKDAAGFFFCLQDRALLCRKCDVAIHTANEYVSAHQRFLLTGIKVGLEATDPGASSSTMKSQSSEKNEERENPLVSKRSIQTPVACENNEVLSFNTSKVDVFASGKESSTGGYAAESIPQWQFDEFLGLNDFSQNYGYMDNSSCKADSGKRGDSDGSSNLRSGEEELDDVDRICQVPDSCAVPQMPSPPTASGLQWPKSFQFQSDNLFSVPNIGSSTIQNSTHSLNNHRAPKRRRQF